MGKSTLFTTLLMIAVNGFWYCATQQASIGETPVIIIPSLASIGLLGFFMVFIRDEWY